MKYRMFFVTHEDLSKTAVSKAMFDDVAKALNREGSIVSILSASENKGSELTGSGLSYYFFKRNSYGKFDLSTIFSLLKASLIFVKLARTHDVVYFRSYPTFIMFGLVGLLLRKKMVFDTRGLFFEELIDSGKINSKLLVKSFSFIERLLLKIATRVIAVTEAQKEYYINLVPSIAHKIIVIPNCAPQINTIADNTNTNVMQLVYVGSLIKWHSPELTRDICKSLSDLGQSYYLTVFTKDFSKAESVFSVLGKNVLIKEHNFRKKPIRYHYGFSLISGGISKTICFPVKFLEYVQSGTKVISSDNVQVCVDLIQKHKLGLLVKNTDKPELIAKELIKDFKVNGQNKVYLPENYRFEDQINQIKQVLTEI